MQIKLAVVRLAVVLAVLFTARYFWWRLFDTMNPAAVWFFWIFLVAEVLNFAETALFYFIAWSPTRYAPPPPLPGKAVDVFITTYNEPPELLRETVICALNIRYPHATYILDDGNRPEIRALAQELHADYIARGERSHAKAGNLNYALKMTDGEFIVTLDADHVPSPTFVDELIGFFADEHIAIVQTNQDFYNLDSFQHLIDPKKHFGWHQQELFFNVIQPGKDYYNATFYCGSPAMLRRSALDQIGGFAVGSVTEDMHTGIRLQERGWRVLYHNKTLARGLAPQTYVAFATQWRRWGQGAMQVVRKERFFLRRGLTLGQRICYMASIYFYWMSYQKFLYILTPIVCLLTGLFPLLTDPATFVKFFVPYFVLNIFSSMMLQGGLRSFIFSEQFNVLKMRVMMESMGGFLQRAARFQVTPKARAAAATFADVVLQLVLLVALLAGVVVGTYKIVSLPVGYQFWALTVNLFWAAFYLVLLVPLLHRALGRSETRQAYRWPARLDIPIRYSATGLWTQQSFARNLNRTGLSITTAKALSAGTLLDLELDLPARTIRATGRVMRSQEFEFQGKPRVANGVHFESITPGDQDEISKYLFFEIAPREGELLRLTHSTQHEEVAS